MVSFKTIIEATNKEEEKSTGVSSNRTVVIIIEIGERMIEGIIKGAMRIEGMGGTKIETIGEKASVARAPRSLVRLLKGTMVVSTRTSRDLTSTSNGVGVMRALVEYASNLVAHLPITIRMLCHAIP